MTQIDDQKFVDDLQQLMEKTKLSSRELAPLFKTSQTTILAWAGGRHNDRPGSPPKQELLRSYALRVMLLLKKVVEAGDLPIPDDVPHKDRARILAEVWAKHLAARPKALQSEE